ncbi:hypothetical protein J6590_034005 [Homalodisca vitripennis]|nr:hypothetical protein J6590_034005 [Homalodisca vitripennis]
MFSFLFSNDEPLPPEAMLIDCDHDGTNESSEADTYTFPPQIDDPQAQEADDSEDPEGSIARLVQDMTEEEIQFLCMIYENDYRESNQGIEQASNQPNESLSTTSRDHLDANNQPHYSGRIEIPEQLQDSAQQGFAGSASQDEDYDNSNPPKRRKICHTEQVRQILQFAKKADTTTNKK